MRSSELIQATVASVVPSTHLSWRRNQAPKLPFAVWYDEPHVPGADDNVLCICHRYWVELYEKNISTDLRDRMFNALNEVYGHVSIGTETYIDSEDCFMVVFRVSEIEGVENVTD